MKKRPSGILRHCQQDKEAKSLCDAGRIMRDKTEIMIMSTLEEV